MQNIHPNILMRYYQDTKWFAIFDEGKFVYGRGHRKTVTQRYYEKLCKYRDKLSENVQIGVADEYIAVVDVNHFRSDMDCFEPLMEKLKSTYVFYPKYPTADAGYGSYNNYIYCQEHSIEKFMFKKETTDQKYRNNPFRAVNFKIDDEEFFCKN